MRHVLMYRVKIAVSVRLQIGLPKNLLPCRPANERRALLKLFLKFKQESMHTRNIYTCLQIKYISEIGYKQTTVK